MTREDLNHRIEICTNKLNKITKRIEKWQSKQNEKDFWKEYEWLVGSDGKESVYNRFYNEYIEKCKVEKSRAELDFVDVKKTLVKYQNALDNLDKFDKAEKIPVIWNFLQQWKVNAKEYYHKELKRLKEVHDWEHEQFKKYANKPEFKQEWRDAYNEYTRRLSTFSSVTRNLDEIYYDETREKELDKILDKEVRAKYERLVNDIVAITGTITDALGLHISPKGELNGLVIGEKGKASIETIGAGGWNQDYINPETGRHGQIFHYRTLIHEIKEKLDLDEN